MNDDERQIDQIAKRDSSDYKNKKNIWASYKLDPGGIELLPRDKAQRERIEQALRENEAKAHAILQAIPDPMLLIAHDGACLNFHSSTANGVFDLSRLVGKNLETALPQEAAGKTMRCIKHTLVIGGMQSCEYPLPISGRLRWFEMRMIAAGKDKVWATVRDITEQKESYGKARKSMARYRGILEKQSDFVCRFLPDGTLSYANKAFRVLLGKDLEKPETDFMQTIFAGDRERVAREMDRLSPGAPTVVIEYRARDSDGKSLWQRWTYRGLYDKNRRLHEYQAVGCDITESRGSRKRLEGALKEKETLLREVHHRVKNNLQILSSLLVLSRNCAENPQAFQTLSDACGKIHTIASIHTQLCQTEWFDRVDISSLVQTLASNLAQLYDEDKHIDSVVRVADIQLPVSQAIPCSLALNELISNAYKYAFEGREGGRIEISAVRFNDDTVLIKVRDDGVGLPEDVDIEKSDTLGLELVQNLTTRQLKGKIQITRSQGTEIAMEFKLSGEK